MNIRNIGIIISREYATRVRKKSFLVITFIVPVLFALLCTLPALIMLLSKEKGKVVEVLDESGIVMPYLSDSDAVAFRDCQGEILDSLKMHIADNGADAILHISPLDSAARTVTATDPSPRRSWTRSRPWIFASGASSSWTVWSISETWKASTAVKTTSPPWYWRIFRP